MNTDEKKRIFLIRFICVHLWPTLFPEFFRQDRRLCAFSLLAPARSAAMPTPGRHPSDAALAAFALGQLEGPAAETVNTHIAACADCRTVVERTPADSLMALLRRAAGSAPAETPSRQGTA